MNNGNTHLAPEATQAEVLEALELVRLNQAFCVLAEGENVEVVDRIVAGLPSVVHGYLFWMEMRFAIARESDCDRGRWQRLVYGTDDAPPVSTGQYLILVDFHSPDDLPSISDFLDYGLDGDPADEDDFWHDGVPFDGDPTVSDSGGAR